MSNWRAHAFFTNTNYNSGHIPSNKNIHDKFVETSNTASENALSGIVLFEFTIKKPYSFRRFIYVDVCMCVFCLCLCIFFPLIINIAVIAREYTKQKMPIFIFFSSNRLFPSLFALLFWISYFSFHFSFDIYFAKKKSEKRNYKYTIVCRSLDSM